MLLSTYNAPGNGSRGTYHYVSKDNLDLKTVTKEANRYLLKIYKRHNPL